MARFPASLDPLAREMVNAIDELTEDREKNSKPGWFRPD
jgi:hypothetical protein